MLSDSNIRETLGPVVDPLQDPNHKPPSQRSAGLIAAFIVVALLWAGAVMLIRHLERISPAIYEPRTGHIYRFYDLFHTVYLTPHGRSLAYTALALPALVTLIVIFYALGRQPEDIG